MNPLMIVGLAGDGVNGWWAHALFALALALMCLALPVSAQVGQTLYADDFEELSEGWVPVGLDGATGSVAAADRGMKIQAEGGLAYGAYYEAESFSGHFEVEASFTREHGVGLALFKEVDGKPSLEDYSLLYVTRNQDGVLEVRLTDRQGGQQDVRDHTGKVDAERYTHRLSGEEYSIPYTQTAGKLRILRHENERFLHFYYSVEKEINGKTYTDWMELAPSKEWGALDAGYFVGLFAVNDAATFDRVRVTQMPLRDASDVAAGFKATHRPYTWSGYTAPAVVVSFGEHTPLGQADRKYVFWELMNNVPAWHLDNAGLFAHGFLETWGGGNPGCHEPMSDRLLAFSNVEILEDNAVRKVIKWTYQLVDPNYKHPDYDKGEETPEAVETYTIYADGSILRKAQFSMKLDTEFRNWHELMELMLIAGENNRPGDRFDFPSLTFHDLDKDPVAYNNDGSVEYRNENERLGPVVMTAHLNDGLDLFYAYSDDESTPQTHTGYPLNYELTWHKRTHNFGHWPVAKQPYAHPFKSGSDWPEHIAHTSLVGMGLDLGRDWEDHYFVREDGRKTRQWVSLMGLDERGAALSGAQKTQAWLYPGTAEPIDATTVVVGYNHEDRCFKFAGSPNDAKVRTTLTPQTQLINPVLCISDWGEREVEVKLNGGTLWPERYVTAVTDGGDLLVLILGDYDQKIEIEVSPR